MIKSIYGKLVLIFILTILIGGLASSLIGLVIIEPRARSEVTNNINGVLSAAKDEYEKGRIRSADIEKLYSSEIVAVRFYQSEKALVEDYHLSLENLKAIDDMPTVFAGKSRGKLNLKMPIGAVKSGDLFIVAILKGNNIIADIRLFILFYNVLSILCGAMITMLAAKLIVRPIKKLISATERIAKGDFEVYIKKERKDEIGQLVDNFNKMTKELSCMEIMRKNFISDISHEFKTPLTSIEGYTKLLRDCNNEEERGKYIDIITKETKRLSMLSRNILMINRIENENIVLTNDTFRLDEQIRHAILLSEDKWSGKDIDLQIDLEETIYTGSESLLYQVWLNLFDNSVKFSKAGDSIEISLKKSDKKVVFTITDYGVGMTEEQLSRMFEKFYTGDKSRNTEGNGLGLSIVKRIVDMHNGRIEVQSRKDEFTEIKVIL